MIGTEENIAKRDPHDQAEVRAFQRFLQLDLGPRPAEARIIRRDYPGWLPYCLGILGPSLWPPEGYDEIPFTGWTMPG